MKKIFSFAAVLLTAISVNAAITELTCAEAKQYALDSLATGAIGSDSVSVTGYVTKDYSGLSRGQQRFSMDDVKGTVETLHCYYANMLPGELALNVGDKVTVKGLLQNYNGSAQIKNGDVAVILERISLKIDTIPSSVCEVISEGEALNDQDKTSDYFTVNARVSSIKTAMNQYGQESFWMVCADNQKELQAYNLVMEDTIEAKVGDSVFVIGKIMKYGDVIELTNGSAKILEKGNVQIDTIEATVAEAVAAGRLLDDNKVAVDQYAVTGYVDSIAYPYKNGSMSFYMTDDMENPTYEFEAYNVKVAEADSAMIVIGAKVKVTGSLQHYVKAATDEKPAVDLIEIMAGGVVELLEQADAVDYVSDNAVIRKRLQNGQLVIFRNGVGYTVTGVNVQ